MKKFLCLVSAGALVLLAGHAHAAELAQGTYRCTIGSYHLGNIEIGAGTYQGPAFDGNYEGAYPLEVTESGTINWGGPLGGISSGGNTVVATVLKDAGGGTVGFDIQIQNASGNFQTISCSPE